MTNLRDKWLAVAVAVMSTVAAVVLAADARRAAGVTDRAAIGADDSLSSASPRPGPCIGDCSGDGQVTVDELLKGVNIALGNTALAECPSFDCNANGQVTVDCLLKAVNAALSGCNHPAGPDITGLWCMTNNIDPGARSDEVTITQNGDQFVMGPCTGHVGAGNGIYFTCPGVEVCKMEFEGIVSSDTTSMSGMGYDEDCSGHRQGQGWQWTAVRGPCPA